MSIAEKFEVIADEVYAKGIEKGRNDEYSDFWDIYQHNGNYMSNISYAFAYPVWTDANYNPKYNIKITNNMYYNSLFYQTGVTDTKVEIDVKDCTVAGTNIFQLSKLNTIRKLIVSEQTTYSNWFLRSSSLENIRFQGVIANPISFADCPLLTKESLLNIFSCLKDLSGTGNSLTLTLGESNLKKLTDEEKAIAQGRGWTLL